MSSELIKVTVKNDQQLVSARDLYKGLGLKGRFSRWVDNNFDLYTKNEDFYKCTSSTVVGNGAKREIVDYALTISMAKQLAMMARTETSKLYREYFLELERKWNDPQNVVQRAMDYGYSAREFNKLFHRMKIQHKVNGQWILYKAYMGQNYTTTKMYSYTDKHGKDHAKPLTAWTQRGRRLIYDVLKENDVLPLIEREDVA